MPDPVRARALVGRDDELGSAGRALAAVATGRGSTLLVTGEAGVGKTRVATEVADRARDLGLAVLTGAAADGAAPLRPLSSAVLDRWRGRPFPSTEALQPFRPALSRLVPGWLEPAAPPPVAADPAVLAEGLLELLGRPAPGTSGTVVVLEDLHWADP
jgi:predicted ATPase